MEHRRIIKQGAVVVATHEDGSIDPAGTFTQGLFVGDTRFLGHFRLNLDGVRPDLMDSGEETLYQAGYLLTNPALPHASARSLRLVQRTAIEDGIVTITLTVRNMTVNQVDFELSLAIDADFFDSFETRGVTREKRGQTFAMEATSTSLRFRYQGLDHATRTTQVEDEPAMERWEQGRLCFPVSLEPDGLHIVTLTITCRTDVPEGTSSIYGPQSSGALQPAWFEKAARMTVSHPIVDHILTRSIDDLRILLTEFPDDLWVPAAGLPRFAVPFGRDSALAGMMRQGGEPLYVRAAGEDPARAPASWPA